MGARNVGRLLSRYLADGDILVLPLGASTDLFKLDPVNGRVELDNAELKLGDADQIIFGDGGDVEVEWTGSIFKIITPLADDIEFDFGNGTNNFDLYVWGENSDYLFWDASHSELALARTARPRGFNAIPRRFELRWVAGQRGKPGLNADIQNASESVREIADPDFELLGTNAVSNCSAIATGGGITLTTTTADHDQVILVPHLDASQSAWATVQWATSKQLIWEALITTGASITDCILWAGLKLTNTSTTATDNEQAFFRYQNGVNSGRWQAVSSVGGTDTEADTGVSVATSTQVHLKIIINSSRIATFYINGALVATSAALASGNLIPYIGVQSEGGSAGAKALSIWGQSISRAA